MSPTSKRMNESFLLQPGRFQNGNDLNTPQSAVSSFNLPAHCDSSLITPVSASMLSSPNMRMGSTASNSEMNLSPLIVSPSFTTNYQGGYSPLYDSNLKSRDRTGGLHIYTLNQNQCASPFTPPTPYYGAYGVSTPPVSATAPNSTSIHHQSQSPLLQSAGAMSSSSHHAVQQPLSNYRTYNHVPIVATPNPSALRQTAIKQERQNSISSTKSPPSSHGSPRRFFSDHKKPIGRKGRKKAKAKSSSPRDTYESLITLGPTDEDERFLLKLRFVDPATPWKEICKQWLERTGKPVEPPALQMKKKRLVDRLKGREAAPSVQEAYNRVKEEWDPDWDCTANSMLKNERINGWPKEEFFNRYNEGRDEELLGLNQMYARKQPHTSSVTSYDLKSWDERNSSSDNSEA